MHTLEAWYLQVHSGSQQTHRHAATTTTHCMW